MFGLILIEIPMESFNESKQTSGYGVVLQIDLMEDKDWEYCREVAEEEEEEEEELRAHVLDKLIAERSQKSFRVMREAISHQSSLLRQTEVKTDRV